MVLLRNEDHLLPLHDGALKSIALIGPYAERASTGGGSSHVDLDARAFSYWDTETHGWKVAPGVYTIYVGRSSRDLPLQGQITVR